MLPSVTQDSQLGMVSMAITRWAMVTMATSKWGMVSVANTRLTLQYSVKSQSSIGESVCGYPVKLPIAWVYVEVYWWLMLACSFFYIKVFRGFFSLSFVQSFHAHNLISSLTDKYMYTHMPVRTHPSMPPPPSYTHTHTHTHTQTGQTSFHLTNQTNSARPWATCHMTWPSPPWPPPLTSPDKLAPSPSRASTLRTKTLSNYLRWRMQVESLPCVILFVLSRFQQSINLPISCNWSNALKSPTLVVSVWKVIIKN